MEKTTVSNEPYLGSPDNPKTAGIVCYITIIGWLIAYFALYRQNRNEVAAYHIRQTLSLHILALVMNILGVITFWGGFPYWLQASLSFLLFLGWFVGLMGAVAGKKRPVPLVGELSQRLFAAI